MTFGDGVQVIPQRQPLYDRMAVLILKVLEEHGEMTSRAIYKATICRTSPTHNKIVWFLKRLALEGKVVKIKQNSRGIIWGLPK